MHGIIYRINFGLKNKRLIISKNIVTIAWYKIQRLLNKTSEDPVETMLTLDLT